MVRGLLLAVQMYLAFDRPTLFGKSLFNPGQGKGQCRIVALELSHQLRRECTALRDVRAGHIRYVNNDVFRVVYGRFQHPVRPEIGAVAIASAGGNTCGNTPQVLDKRQAQHNGNGPQLPQGKRRHPLVGRNNDAKIVFIHPAVHMGNQVPDYLVHPRQTGRNARTKTRQFAAVTPGKVFPCEQDLLLDQEEIVEEPRSGGQKTQPGQGPAGEQRVRFRYELFVGGQPRQQFFARGPKVQFVQPGHYFALFVEPVAAV